MKLPSSWSLPDRIKNRFGQRSAGKQRAMVAEGHLLLVLHKPPKNNRYKREAVFVWRDPEGYWKHSGGKSGVQTLVKHLQEYNTAQEKIVQKYERAESAEDFFRVLEEMGPLRLATKNLHATLQAAREGIPGDRDIIDLRDWAYDLERTLDLVYENAKNAVDYRIAQRAEQQTQLSLESVKVGHRLNLLAAIFFPLTAISCVFGMNLTNGLENSPTFLFWFVFLVGLILGLFVQRWVVTGK